jgi:CRP-like cAMP-binding protein
MPPLDGRPLLCVHHQTPRTPPYIAKPTINLGSIQPSIGDHQNGRRQITGFVGPGQFLGLAVSDTYAFSAEATEQVRYCRFNRAALHNLLHDFPLMKKRLFEVASNELVAA